MGQIGEIMDEMMSLQPKPSGCVANSRQNEIANDVRGRYGAFDNVLGLFAPKHQAQYTANIERCYFGVAPRLNHLKFAYGDTAPVEWLSYQLIDLCRFANTKTMTDHQIHELSVLIAREYYYLKLTEFMVFMAGLKSGKYGKVFYGSIDPMDIMLALRQFAEERIDIVRKKEEEDARREREMEREARKNDYLKPHEVQALRERLQKKWEEEGQ